MSQILSSCSTTAQRRNGQGLSVNERLGPPFRSSSSFVFPDRLDELALAHLGAAGDAQFAGPLIELRTIPFVSA
jgi:hypothetical protein